jgi:hypothetical protein
MFELDRYGFHKKHAGTSYVELVFLHSVGSAGHVVHFIASGAQDVNAPFSLLGWDRYGLHKKGVVTHYVELYFFHPMGCAHHIVYSGASGA